MNIWVILSLWVVVYTWTDYQKRIRSAFNQLPTHQKQEQSGKVPRSQVFLYEALATRADMRNRGLYIASASHKCSLILPKQTKCSFFLNGFLIHFWERGKERDEREREREKYIDVREKHCSVASPNRNGAHNVGMCLDQESNQQPFGYRLTPQLTELCRPGQAKCSWRVELTITPRQ